MGIIEATSKANNHTSHSSGLCGIDVMHLTDGARLDAAKERNLDIAEAAWKETQLIHGAGGTMPIPCGQAGN